MDETLNLDAEARVAEGLRAKLLHPENYTQAAIAEMHDRMQVITKQQQGYELVAVELKAEIQALVDEEPKLLQEKQAIEATMPDLQDKYALALVDYNANDLAHREHYLKGEVSRLKGDISKNENRLAEINEKLSLRLIKESSLASLWVKMDRLKQEYDVLETKSNPKTLPLDLINDEMGAMLYFADYERANGRIATNALKSKVQDAKDKGEAYLINEPEVMAAVAAESIDDRAVMTEVDKTAPVMVETTPAVESLPEIEVPVIEVAEIEVPAVELPSVEIPAVELPEVEVDKPDKTTPENKPLTENEDLAAQLGEKFKGRESAVDPEVMGFDVEDAPQGMIQKIWDTIKKGTGKERINLFLISVLAVAVSPVLPIPLVVAGALIAAEKINRDRAKAMEQQAPTGEATR